MSPSIQSNRGNSESQSKQDEISLKILRIKINFY